MQQEEIIKIVNDLLVSDIEIDEAQIRPNADLKKDLGIDSLDFVDLFVLVEHHFGFKMKAEEMADVKTLQDFYHYISGRINPS